MQSKQNSLLVTALNEEEKHKATEEMKQTICQLKNVNVERITTKRNGTAVVEFQNSADLEANKERFIKKMNRDFTVYKEKLTNPKLKVVGILNIEFSKDALVTEILGRNLATDDSLQVLHTYVNDKNTQCAILEVSPETYSKIMERRRLYVNW